MVTSGVLDRLERATRSHSAAADADRLALITTDITLERYRDFLVRVYGFEAPVECGFLMTTGLDGHVALRSRTKVRLLKADLLSLGVTSTSELPRLTTTLAFPDVPEALAWMYVLERNTQLHGILRRHLEHQLGAPFRASSTYLAGYDRAAAARWREILLALDSFWHQPQIARRISIAAAAAFRCQRRWFSSSRSPSHADAA